MHKDVALSIKDRITACRFSYTKEKNRDIAPCGQIRRCKSHSRECEGWKEPDSCERAYTCNEKASMRLYAESMLKDWTKRKHPRRLRQMMTWWKLEYAVLGEKCIDCKAVFCSVNGVVDVECRQIGSCLGGVNR